MQQSQILEPTQLQFCEMPDPVAPTPPYVKVLNFPGLYRHVASGRYYGMKKLKGKRKERSLGTADRKIAERRFREWVMNLEKLDTELEKTTLRQLAERLYAVNNGLGRGTQVATRSILTDFLKWYPYGSDTPVSQVRTSQLDEWLALHEPRLKNTTYNRYAGVLKQLFEIAVNDKIIVESPFKYVKKSWKRPQVPLRCIPTVEQFQNIVDCIRAQPFTDHAEDSADFVEFLGLAGLGQAEASSLKWGDINWHREQMSIRRHKTDTRFYVPIYAHLRPLLEKLRSKAGKVSSETRVFKIKNAKKALASACVRLGYHKFTQRNMRQGLIMRLWKARVDIKLIAKWQGHQDGGQLIIDTYTEVFGIDDDDYERLQLAKIALPLAA